MRNTRARLQKRLAVLFSRPCGRCPEEARFRDRGYHSEALDEIRSDWTAYGRGEAPSDSEIVTVALRLMQMEIDAGLGDEVLKDVRREVNYRRWCATDEYAPTVPINGGDQVA